MQDEVRQNSLEYQIFKDKILIYNYNISMHTTQHTQISGAGFCVGFGLLPDDSLSHWIPMACNMSYMASFFCSSNLNLNSSHDMRTKAGVKYPTNILVNSTSHRLTNNYTRATRPSIAIYKCPDGWVMINKYCFNAYAVSSPITFPQAEAICSASQARLPFVSNPYLGHSSSYESSMNTSVIPP